MRGSGAFRTSVMPGPWVRNPLWRTARAVPSLDLQLADNKSLVDGVTGQNLVTFTRASDGTFVNSSGLIQTGATNEARFDHNPTTGESLGLLVEEARTNLVANSADFSTFWTQTRLTVTDNQIAAPDGTITADLLTEDTTASASHTLQGSFSVTAGLNYTFSVWAKQNTSVATTRNIRITFPIGQFGAAVSASFNLSTGIITTFNSPVATSYEAYPDGWAKVSITALCLTTGAASLLNVQIAAGTTSVYTGNGTSGNYLWGAQLEVGAFPTSYIPTTGATATRAADVASITGSNFSSFYNQAEGTVFADASGVNNINVSTRAYVEIRDASSSERILLGYGTTSNNRFLVGVSGGVTAADISVASLPKAKATGAYKVNSFQLASNNILGTEDVVGLVPTVTQLQIGSQDGSTANTFINGTIKRLVYWGQRLPNTTLQSITL